ncbi:dipeptide ABC transporter ATP-binding protein [Anaeromicropila herbilytica]|uniref:ABC transporter ATP-binding protein n=1 Tax=Anaeromicropila herbilytica TaxID=2785025 RepID=A0A7R7EPA7_9FIRM|nr:ABC transporter ATP-binding protein [Anaeromicropila herbilytica]BCN32429.1 ABC transporter ATP-binding protein [Anaeromicropila herbilytica]
MITNQKTEPKLLEVKNLEVGFYNKNKFNKIVNQISFDVYQGEVLGIVGESGSGKSMTALTIADLLSKEAVVSNGTICLQGNNLLTLDKESLRKIKGKEIGFIFQEPMTSLNPLIPIGKQVEEVLKIHETLSKEERKRRTMDMLFEVGLKEVDGLYRKYPHELSGGMRQRVMIAMAMICEPKLLIADEPTTALDVTIQSQILELIKKLCREKNTTVIFISHDLGVIKEICNRAIVMSEGNIVEEGNVKNLFENPRMEYTKQLIDSVPSIKKGMERKACEQKTNSTKNNKMLDIKELSVFYDKKGSLFQKAKKEVIVKNVSFQVIEGEILGIVGESGCGKTTLSKAIVGLNRDIEGSIESIEKSPQMVFQDPYQSLNPAKKVGWILEEPLRLKGGYTKEDRKKKVDEMLVKVGLSKEYKNRYIHELSGGQRQRISIASAVITNPKLIILDEPVSALDVTVQAQILELLRTIQKEYGLTYLFISHDLNVIYEMCNRVLVMYQGRIVEDAKTRELYDNPQHEYTKRLLKVIPEL